METAWEKIKSIFLEPYQLQVDKLISNKGKNLLNYTLRTICLFTHQSKCSQQQNYSSICDNTCDFSLF